MKQWWSKAWRLGWVNGMIVPISLAGAFWAGWQDHTLAMLANCVAASLNLMVFANRNFKFSIKIERKW